jgi:hypothetical protein
MRMAVTSAILCLVLPVGACGSGKDGGPSAAVTTAPSSTAGAAAYVARPDDQWVLKEARNPLPEHTLSRVVEPSLDWYAEYEAPPANSPRRVRLSGHNGDANHVAGEVKGFTFQPATVGSYPAVSAVSPDPDGRPAVVVFAVRTDFSVMVLSYELPLPELLAWADELIGVTESEWVQAGGEIER